jgi:hypothetical protein
MYTNFSEEHAASIFTVKVCRVLALAALRTATSSAHAVPESGGSTFLRNVCVHPQGRMFSQPKDQKKKNYRHNICCNRDLYSGGSRFGSRPGHWTSWRKSTYTPRIPLQHSLSIHTASHKRTYRIVCTPTMEKETSIVRYSYTTTFLKILNEINILILTKRKSNLGLDDRVRVLAG